MISTIKASGFCHGVQVAVDRARANLDNVPKGVYLFGDLVNNSHVMDGFRKQGYIVVDNVGDIPPNTIAILRAHGVPKAVYQALEAKNVTIEDCTCVKVKNIHKIVSAPEQVGSHIIIVGKKNHPEVVGILGWCGDNQATVVESPADLEHIHFTQPICVVGQTTCKKAWWEAACDFILQKAPNGNIHNTLCNVSERIEKAADLAAGVDVMVVVGDKKSANSMELFHACEKVCRHTIFVSGLEDMKPLPPHATIGLVGSASTPVDIVQQVHDYLLFADFLADAKQQIEYYAKCEEVNLRLVKSAGLYIDEAIKDLFDQNRDGKRIRGAMIMLGERIASGANQYFLEVAAAYELFQTAILIHDDIIDRSETRRGRKTIHAHSRDVELARGTQDPEHVVNAKHFGIARAICIGDYGMFEANYQLAHAKVDDATKVRLLKEFANTQLITLEGEITDVMLPYEPIDPAQKYEDYDYAINQIYRDKTAWYTLAGPLIIGTICGGGDFDLEIKLRDIAMPLGVAFQIKDDLLGMYGDEKAIGKPAISDMVEAKQTFIFGYAYKHANPTQRETLDRLYGNQNATPEDLQTVRDIFTATGAQAYAEDKVATLSQESLALISQMDIDPEYQALLRGLVYYLLVRKY